MFALGLIKDGVHSSEEIESTVQKLYFNPNVFVRCHKETSCVVLLIPLEFLFHLFLHEKFGFMGEAI